MKNEFTDLSLQDIQEKELMRAFRQFWFWWIYWWRLYRSQVHPTRVSFWLFKPTFSFKAFSYFTFSSFCRNFVGKADNEHNGTIKRKGSLFFGDERSLSKIVQTWKLNKWGWCARDFCEDALSTGERNIGAKRRQISLDPSNKLLLLLHQIHTFLYLKN